MVDHDLARCILVHILPTSPLGAKPVSALKAVEKHFERVAIGMLPEPLRARYTPLICQDKSEINAKVAKIADTFAALIKCQWEISRGNGVEFSAAKESLQEQIDVYAEKYDFVRTFITLFLHEDITRISVDEQSMSKCHETG